MTEVLRKSSRICPEWQPLPVAVQTLLCQCHNLEGHWSDASSRRQRTIQLTRERSDHTPCAHQEFIPGGKCGRLLRGQNVWYPDETPPAFALLSAVQMAASKEASAEVEEIVGRIGATA